MKIKNTHGNKKIKLPKKGKQSLSSVTRRFRNFSISKIDLTPPPLTLTPILAQWWIWRPSHARTMPRQNVKRYINSQVLKWREYSWLNINAKLNLPTWIQRLTKQFQRLWRGWPRIPPEKEVCVIRGELLHQLNVDHYLGKMWYLLVLQDMWYSLTLWQISHELMSRTVLEFQVLWPFLLSLLVQRRVIFCLQCGGPSWIRKWSGWMTIRQVHKNLFLEFPKMQGRFMLHFDR